MRALLLAVMFAGCIDASLVPCGASECAATQVCSQDFTCVSPDQIAACTNAADGGSCTFGTTHGFCHHGACVEELGICGDGVARLSLDELCDCGSPDVLAAPPPGCNGFNSDMPGATCRADCKPAACGDGIVDTNELCDDGNTIGGDGCRADCQGRFTKMQTPSANSLQSVLALGPTNAYAFGLAGTVIHFDGAAWSNVSIGNPGDLFAAWANGPNEIYAGGTASGDATVYVFDGTTWTPLEVAAGGTVTSVWASSPRDIYAIVGFTISPLLHHYDGVSWSTLTLPCTQGVNAVVGTSAASVYAAAGGGLCYFDGQTWAMIDATEVAKLAWASTDVIALSSSPISVRRWTGTVGGTSTIVPGTAIGFAATSNDEVLVVSTEGEILQLRGGVWTNLVSPTELQLNAVGGSDRTDVFIVGGAGTVLH